LINNKFTDFIKSNGKPLSGRACCEKVDPVFETAHNDLHNLFPIEGEINGDRRDYLKSKRLRVNELAVWPSATNPCHHRSSESCLRCFQERHRRGLRPVAEIEMSISDQTLADALAWPSAV
jgi:hypothetical protein